MMQPRPAARQRPGRAGQPTQTYGRHNPVPAWAMAFDGSRVQFYRDKARQIRGLADACLLPDIKEQLERIAQQYEVLARQVETGSLPR